MTKVKYSKEREKTEQNSRIAKDRKQINSF